MAHLAIRHKVQDYTAWKGVFDRFAPERRAGGEISYQIYHLDDDHNEIAVLMEWDTIDKAKAFVASDTVRNAMQEAGVVGGPTVIFLNAGDSGHP